ncbi:MAG: DUF4089 domain-containing protein [Cyanobacteria bacterium SW_9_44_58]|nr:MAG: DUF4089 domain-containing protein [Cyanobacteria bacterium SW_9_44_58]
MSDSSSQSSPPPSDYRAYVEQTAGLLELNLPEDSCDRVIENFTQLSAIAQQVMEFSLPSYTEIAPVFKP